MLTGIGSSTGRVSRATGNSSLGQCTSGSGPVQRAPSTVTSANRASTNGVRCFGCGKIDHHQAYCKRQGKKALFIYPEDYKEEDAYVGEEPVIDSTDEGDDEVLKDDMGPALMVKRMCLKPRVNEDE